MRSGVVRGSFGIRSGSVRDLFGVCSGSVCGLNGKLKCTCFEIFSETGLGVNDDMSIPVDENCNNKSTLKDLDSTHR